MELLKGFKSWKMQNSRQNRFEDLGTEANILILNVLRTFKETPLFLKTHQVHNDLLPSPKSFISTLGTYHEY